MLPFFFILVIVELIALSFLSRTLTQRLYETVYVATKARSVAISAITLLLFFGTVVHELSHLFTAGILGVRTGKLELAPESIRGEHIHAGSVMVEETDPIRRSLIGISPVTTGITILTALSYFLPSWTQQAFTAIQNGQYTSLSIFLLLSSVFALFVISNTMFSSPEDLKGVPAVGITLGIFIIALYLIGIRIALTASIETIIMTVTKTLATSLGIVLAVNGALLLMANVLLTLTSRVTKRIIVKG